jgi:hypothetical protein
MLGLIDKTHAEESLVMSLSSDAARSRSNWPKRGVTGALLSSLTTELNNQALIKLPNFGVSIKLFYYVRSSQAKPEAGALLA